MQVLTLVLFLMNYHLQVTRSQSVCFAPEGENEVFRNLISSKSHLLLGSSAAIYRLDDNLAKQQKKVLSSPNRMLVTDYVGSFKDSVLSCDSNTCFLAQVTDFNSVSWQVNTLLRSSTAVVVDNAVAVFAPRANGTSDLTFGERADGLFPRYFTKGSLVNAGVGNSSYSFLQYAKRIEGNRFESLTYLAEFPLRYANDSGYVYFVTRPTQEELRVVRICEDDAGSFGVFASHFEAVIRCGENGVRARDSTAATFINITTVFNGRPTILLTQTRTITSSNLQLEVCAFDIGTINTIMTQKYEQCIGGLNNVVSGFERDGTQEMCVAVPNHALPIIVSYPSYSYIHIILYV